MIQKTSSTEMRHVAFKVITTVPLPAGEQVFVTGNQEGLGRWKADEIPLTRVEDNTWTVVTLLPADSVSEYKITRGAWDREEALEGGGTPNHHRIPPGEDTQIVHRVHHWVDDPPERISRISGDYEIHDGFASKVLTRTRRVIVWLPPSYKGNAKTRYPVLYMHDGQQIFDPATSTWNQDWEIDEWCLKLSRENRMKECIVVGIYSTADRMLEYHPTDLGKEYCWFVTEELKPFIDKTYRTLPDRDNTAVAGASMGGNISFYMAWSRPDVFFGAACLSPAFRLHKGDQPCLDMVAEADEVPDIKLYLYCGGADELEQKLLEQTREMKEALAAKGVVPGKGLEYVEDQDAEHLEADWSRHSDHWLLYLLGS